MKRITRWLSGLALLSPTLSFGLGIRIADQGSLATARGNAFAATADDPSAIYYNPAGITQLEGQNALAGLYSITLKSYFKSAATGAESDTITELLGVPHFYYTTSLQNLPLSFGVGLYSPYGLALEWPDSSGLRLAAKRGQITYLTLNPVIAWKAHPTFSIAAGPTINYAKAKLTRGTDLPTGTPGPGEYRLEGDDFDAGFNVGVLWQPHPKHSFGISYRSETTMNFQGDAEVRPFVPLQDASAEFPFPQNVVVGWSFRPTPAWNLEFNADWTDWDRLDAVPVKAGALSGPLPFYWQSSFFYEWGVTRYLENGLRLSAGYIFSENSVPEASFNPSVPDSDRHIFSIGVGGKRKRISWDAAYQLAYGPPRDVRGTFAGLADGRYEFFSHAVTINIAYHF